MVEQSRRSSGNVFEDLGFPPEEAARLLIQCDSMLEVKRILLARLGVSVTPRTHRVHRVADNGSAPDEWAGLRELVDALPDRATGDDLAYQIYLLASIEAGLADVEAGRTVSHDEAVARIRSRIRRAP